MKNKNVLIVIFVIAGMILILNFRDHNQNRAIDACMAGSQKLDQPMTRAEAREFCEEKIKNKK